MPSRCTIRKLFTEPGIVVVGYAADGRLEVTGTYGLTIGRLVNCEVHIMAMIGGRRTYNIRWSERGWMFHVANEWAIARLNGELLGGRFPQRALHDGDVIEICTIHGALAHRFAVEIADAPNA